MQTVEHMVSELLEDLPIGMRKQIQEWTSNELPTIDQRRANNEIDKATRHLMAVIYLETPKCADQSAAIRLVREARLTAREAVASMRHPSQYQVPEGK
jgi:hypothetical protein